MPDESSNEATGASQETEGLDRKRGSSRNESNRYSSTPSGIMAALASSTAVFPATGAFSPASKSPRHLVSSGSLKRLGSRKYYGGTHCLRPGYLNVVSFGAFSGTAAAFGE